MADYQNPATEDLDFNGHRGRNAAASNLAGDYVTRGELDGALSATGGSSFLKLDGSNAMGADLDHNNFKAVNLAAGTAAGDATRKDQQLLRDGTQAATADISLGNHRLTAVASGTASDHGINKGQLDSAISSEASARSSADTNLQNQIDSMGQSAWVRRVTTNSSPSNSVLTWDGYQSGSGSGAPTAGTSGITVNASDMYLLTAFIDFDMANGIADLALRVGGTAIYTFDTISGRKEYYFCRPIYLTSGQVIDLVNIYGDYSDEHYSGSCIVLQRM